jgi:phospholipid transport system substrate-binding protein
MPRRLLATLLLLVSFALVGSPARAASAPDASGFITTLINQALTDLANPQVTPADREKAFRRLLLADFDMPRIAKFVLGRYWNGANDQERQNFQALFEDYIIHSYSVRFSSYSGQEVKVTAARPESDTTTIVMTSIAQPNGAPPTKVDWRVRKEDSDFKIVDVDVEGVSMLITQREQFSTVIQRSGGTVAGLNQALQQKLASGDTSLAAPMLPAKK